MSFLPYGFNGSYVHLPQNTSFCVKQGKKVSEYQTDNYGGRLLDGANPNNEIQVFGDSQVLGLDINKTKHHYLSNIYDDYNFIIYAAPNNGPYEVINFLNKNEKILKKRITVTFNFSTDIYRIKSYWSPKNFVALRDYELNEILQHPLKYKLIVFKNLLLNKNFTISRYDNKKMQDLFLNSNKKNLKKYLIKYFGKLNETAIKMNLEIDFIVTHPYWVYTTDKKNKKLILNQKLNNDVETLICSSFQSTEKVSKIFISQVPKILKLGDLTTDKRHLKSKKIKLKRFSNVCK